MPEPKLDGANFDSTGFIIIEELSLLKGQAEIQ
jgi:hypothetical protein